MSKKVIDEISDVVESRNGTFTSMGVKNGLAGVSLFYYYKNLYNNNTKNSENCILFLEMAIEGLNEDYKGDSIIRDIIEIGQLLDFYVQKKILSVDDVYFYFENFNDILIDFLNEEIFKKRLNPVFGAISFGYYFLNAKDYISESFLTRVIDKIYVLIKELMVEDNGFVYWESDVVRDMKKLIEFNVTHGVAGIINFLLSVYKFEILNNEDINTTLHKAIKFILNYKRSEGESLFPFDIESRDKKKFSLNLIYGDIGIGYTIYRAGKLLNKDNYINFGKDILINSAKFQDYKENYMSEANLNYGCLGLCSFFRFFNGLDPNNYFEKASKYWYDIYPKFKKYENEWAGFESINNKWDINTELSFSHGIIGICIALMSYEKKLDLDFLRFYNYCE